MSANSQTRALPFLARRPAGGSANPWLALRRRVSGVSSPSRLPWAKPRNEWLLLTLVGFAALSPLNHQGTQDASRLCLTLALLHGHLAIEPCARATIDVARYNGHTYSDKAPGLSFFAIPVAWATGLPTAAQWHGTGELHLWLVRFATSGLAFLVLAFLVGRISEGIAPRLGSAALVAFALGTYVAPLAATTLDHVLAGAFAFGGFVLAWSRRYLLAGLLAGAAFDTNYLCALIAIVLAAYVLVAAGKRPLARYALGAAPMLALLAAYNWAAFGSPFHISYHYVANQYAQRQNSGLFGIHLPTWSRAAQVLADSRGILVASPIIVIAVAGLVLLARRHRLEAIVCGVVFGLLLVANCGYFLPLGGVSPGPRFLVPALPFVALGLAPAFARWFKTTAVVAAASIVAMTALTLTWAKTFINSYTGTIWGAIGRLFTEGAHSKLVGLLTRNVLAYVDISKGWAAVLVALTAVAAYLVALAAARRAALPSPQSAVCATSS